MVYLPVPCYRVPAGFGKRHFAPGTIVLSAQDEELARARIPEESRYHGFWRFLGQSYDRKHHDLCLLIADKKVLTLHVNCAGWMRKWSYEFSDASGQPCGSMQIKPSQMRVPTFDDRVILTDSRRNEIGEIEIRQKLMQGGCTLTDMARGHKYQLRYAPAAGSGSEGILLLSKTPAGMICSETATDIDTRLILGLIYYVEFFRDRFDS